MTIPAAVPPTACRHTLSATVNLGGWTLGDKNKRRHPLDGIALEVGAVTTVTLPGKTIHSVTGSVAGAHKKFSGGWISFHVRVYGLQFRKREGGI